MGNSGVSYPVTGLLEKDRLPPMPPTNFIVSENPSLHSKYSTFPDEYAKITFTFTAPVASEVTIWDEGDAEATPTDSRILRVNAPVGDRISVYYNDNAVIPETHIWLNVEVLDADDGGDPIIILTNETIIEATPNVDYSALDGTKFYGASELSDLAGFRLYMKETEQTEVNKGTMVKEYKLNDKDLINNNDGTYTLIFRASNNWYDGRKLYFGLTAIDDTLPTPNESRGDLNAWCITIPGQAHIVSVVPDRLNRKITLTYDNITENGMNPYFRELMYSGATPVMEQFSVKGGYDIYRTIYQSFSFSNGGYIAIDENNGRITDGQIYKGDVLFVHDRITGHAWTAYAFVDGRVDINDNNLIYGEKGFNYNIHSTNNLTIEIAIFSTNIEEDSILPLTSEATPKKQYLTDAQNIYEDSNLDLKHYCYLIESVDAYTTVFRGKLT